MSSKEPKQLKEPTEQKDLSELKELNEHAANIPQVAMAQDDSSFAHENQRFHINPIYRVSIILASASLIGGVAGTYDGTKKSSLQFLAENAHRLPTSMKGWYFYHKRKNYVLVRNGMIQGAKTSLKVTSYCGLFFGLEALIDHLKGGIDFTSTAISTTVVGWTYARITRLSRYQTLNYMKTGLILGLASGLVQDGLLYIRGDNVWYLRKYFGISPRNFNGNKINTMSETILEA